MKRSLLFAGLGLLTGCGAQQDLRPAPGDRMPVAPATAPRAPTTEELLTPPPIARPQRVDEPLSRSEEREEDRFDLPPK